MTKLFTRKTTPVSALAPTHTQAKEPTVNSNAIMQRATPISGALLYRINVAEAKLGVSRSTIYRMVNDGTLKLVKIGRRSSGITAESIYALISIEQNKAMVGIGGDGEEQPDALVPG